MSVCRAFASWLRLTVEPFPAEAAQHLVQMVLQALSSKDTFDSAVDAIVEVIYRTAMWQERKQLSPEWGTIVQAVLQVVRLAARWVLNIYSRLAWQKNEHKSMRNWVLHQQSHSGVQA